MFEPLRHVGGDPDMHRYVWHTIDVAIGTVAVAVAAPTAALDISDAISRHVTLWGGAMLILIRLGQIAYGMIQRRRIAAVQGGEE